MNQALVWGMTGAVAIAAAAAGVWFGQRDAAVEQAGASAPPAQQNAATNPAAIMVKDLDGKPHSLAEWQGSVVVVNFWATWCPPCVKEIPAFVQLQQEWGERGLQFVGIALDDPEPTRAFAEAHAVNYPILVGENEVMQLMREMGNAIGGLPYTVVLDRQGNSIHTHQGEWSPAEAREILSPLLAPETAP